MTATIDAFQLLRNIGQNETLFGCIGKDIHKSALALANKYLKSKGFNLAGLRAFRLAITDDVLLSILDGLSDRELVTLTKKIDKYYPNLADAKGATLRPHLYNLASTGQAPHSKPAPAARPKKTASNKVTPTTKSGAKWAESMEVKPNRRRT